MDYSTKNKKVKFGKTARYINFDSKINQWLVLFFLAFIWGSSFILMKRGLESFSYFQVGSFRVFFSFLLYLPLIVYNFKRLNSNNIKWLIVVGFIGNGIPALLFSMAQTQISSLLSGMLNSLTPIFVLIVSTLLFKSKPHARSIFGTLLGLLGAVSLIWFSSNAQGQYTNNIYYALLVVLATTFYAFSINVTKHKLNDLNGVEVASLAFLFIGPLSGMYLGFSDFTPAIETPDYLQNMFFVFILATFSSFVAVMTFNVLIKHTKPVFASSVTYIIPIFAIAWGISDGETINLSSRT